MIFRRRARWVPVGVAGAVLAAVVVVSVAGSRAEPGPLRLAEGPGRPTPLGPLVGGAAFALAGERVLVSDVRDHALRVGVLGVDGKPAAPPVLTARSPDGSDPAVQIDASSQAVGVVVTWGDDGDEVALSSAQAFVGAPGAPLRPVGALRRPGPSVFYPGRVQVDGAHVFVTEYQAESGSAFAEIRSARQVVFDGPAAAPRVLTLPGDVLQPVFAGDLVAYPVAGPGADATRVLVRDWRTGALRGSTRMSGTVVSLDLRPDGVAIAAVHPASGRLARPFSRLVEIRPGAPPRVIAADGAQPVWAGSSVVFTREGSFGERAGQLRVAGPDHRIRSFGVLTHSLGELIAEDRRVLWRANGCLLAADLQAPLSRGPAAGPCARSELIVARTKAKVEVGRPRLGRDRRITVPLHCVAAARQGCRGRVVSLGYETEPTPFRIAAGRTRLIGVRLTGRGFAEALRTGRELGFRVKADTIDPAGRRSTLTDLAFNVELAPGAGNASP